MNRLAARCRSIHPRTTRWILLLAGLLALESAFAGAAPSRSRRLGGGPTTGTGTTDVTRSARRPLLPPPLEPPLVPPPDEPLEPVLPPAPLEPS